MIKINTTITGIPDKGEARAARIAIIEENDHRTRRVPPPGDLPFSTQAEVKASLEAIFDERIETFWIGEMGQAPERNFKKFTPADIASIKEEISSQGLTATEVIAKLQA